MYALFTATCSSSWLEIACASTTSEAVELAQALSYGERSLPHAFTSCTKFLSPRALRNVNAAVRALELHAPNVLDGYVAPAWTKWNMHTEMKETERDDVRDARENEKCAKKARLHSNLREIPGSRELSVHNANVLARCARSDDNDNGDDARDESRHVQAVLPERTSTAAPAAALGHCLGVSDAPSMHAEASSAGAPSAAMPTRVDEGGLRKHVLALHEWASARSHTKPPSDAISFIQSHNDASLVACTLFTDVLSLSERASLLVALSESNVRLISVVFQGPLRRTISGLTMPAPRDLMSALLTLCERHRRSALDLFQIVGSSQPAPKAPVAEVLVRITGVLEPRACRSALETVCKGTWGEDGVRIVEALLNKCKDESSFEIADILAKGLERNVRGLETSLRYGKLLMVAVRDVPGVKEKYADVIRNIAAISKVFLAKRALSMLPK